jgi:hypothetical protein
MASRRFLRNKRALTPFLKLAGGLLLGVMILSSCGTTISTTDDSGTRSDETAAEEVSENNLSSEFIAILNVNRSNLNDVYATGKNDIPQLFLQKSKSRDIGNPLQGYRIQILSTRSVKAADSLANNFRTWAETTFQDYIPKAYVQFQQPYYKVHVGNFHFQEQAMRLNKMLKSRYPDAWIVPNKIEPALVPKENNIPGKGN